MASDINMPILIVDDYSTRSLRQQRVQSLRFSALPSASGRLAPSCAREITGRGE